MLSKILVAAWIGGLLSLGVTAQIPDLLNASIDDLAEGLQQGTFTSVQLTTAYIARIRETNDVLKAVLEINSYALSDAAASDAARRNGQLPTSPLAGIPILVKDNIANARPDQTYMNTTAGSLALLGSFPAGDSTMIAKLKSAGAIILGKTALSQWANYRSTNSSNGWNAIGGQATGVYYPNQDPSGSSSGSGIAAAIGLAAAALGSETSGSIISPGQSNNLCAIKPSVGLTSRFRVVPISGTQDTIGPMARDCRSAARLLTVIAGKDSEDNATLDIPFDTVPDYAARCNANGLRGARIGIPSNFIAARQPNNITLAAFNTSISTIRSLGSAVFENANFPALADLNNASQLILPLEFIRDLKTYLDGLASIATNVTDVRSLIAFTQSTPREEYPSRNTLTWENALALNLSTTSPEYLSGLARNLYLGSNGTILGALDANNLTALIMPSSLSPGVAAIAGYPVVTVPLGFYPQSQNVTLNTRGNLVANSPNFPFGLSFIGRRFSEADLIAYACAFEAATQVRLKGPQPYLNVTANLRNFVNNTTVSKSTR